MPYFFVISMVEELTQPTKHKIKIFAFIFFDYEGQTP